MDIRRPAGRSTAEPTVFVMNHRSNMITYSCALEAEQLRFSIIGEWARILAAADMISEGCVRFVRRATAMHCTDACSSAYPLATEAGVTRRISEGGLTRRSHARTKSASLNNAARFHTGGDRDLVSFRSD